MDASGWPGWMEYDDQDAFNQFPNTTDNSGAYHEPTLDAALAEFTGGIDTNGGLVLPINFQGMNHAVPNAPNFSAPETSFYNVPASTTSQALRVDQFTTTPPVRQAFNNVVSATSAYGTYLDNNITNEQVWLGNPSFITDRPNLVHSPLPLQSHLPGTGQSLPTTPNNRRSVERSPTAQTTRKTTRFNSQQRNTLQAWYDQHKDDTYANEADLGMLQALTGLDARQVRAWLSRARRKEPIIPRRQLTMNIPNKTKPVTAVSEVRAIGTTTNASIRVVDENISDDIVMSSLEVVPSSTRASSTDCEPEDADGWITDDDMPTFVIDTLANSPNSALHWWMESLPNNMCDHPEPPALKPLTPPHILPHPSRPDTRDTEERMNARKLARLHTMHDDQSDDYRLTTYDTYDRSLLSPNHVFQPMDDSRDNSASSEFGRSMMARSTATRGSGHSGHTSRSTHSGISFESRKGRRRMQRQHHMQRLSGSGKSDDSLTTGKNECPVCSQEFSCKSSCKRHVKSVHAPSVVWTCGPTTPASDDEGDGRDRSVPVCCFCSQRDCQHRLIECWSKPVRERTFYRRDHFKQHLVGTHKVNAELIGGLNLDSWERPYPVPYPTEQS